MKKSKVIKTEAELREWFDKNSQYYYRALSATYYIQAEDGSRIAMTDRQRWNLFRDWFWQFTTGERGLASPYFNEHQLQRILSTVGQIVMGVTDCKGGGMSDWSCLMHYIVEQASEHPLRVDC